MFYGAVLRREGCGDTRTRTRTLGLCVAGAPLDGTVSAAGQPVRCALPAMHVQRVAHSHPLLPPSARRVNMPPVATLCVRCAWADTLEAQGLVGFLMLSQWCLTVPAPTVLLLREW